MQERFNVNRRRLCGVAAAAVAAGPVGVAGLLFSERSTAMNYKCKTDSSRYDLDPSVSFQRSGS
jgi:hypothetical protein